MSTPYPNIATALPGLSIMKYLLGTALKRGVYENLRSQLVWTDRERLRLHEQKWIGSKLDPIYFWCRYALPSHEISQVRSSPGPLSVLFLDLFQSISSLEPIHLCSCKRSHRLLKLSLPTKRLSRPPIGRNESELLLRLKSFSIHDFLSIFVSISFII